MVEHILRRMGFGASPDQLAFWTDAPVTQVVTQLLNYESQPNDVDSKINNPAYVGVTTRGQFAPDTVINDTRQRWLFRMVHSQRPLEEKMALFWHNHFATAYTKVAGAFGSVHGAKMMDANPANFNNAFKGQIQLFREFATGNFRDLLIEVAKDPAMIVWLDGRTNTKAKPQENFGREVMELFTLGLGNYTEQDVYAAARVFTGWNIELVGADRTDQVNSYYRFVYQANQHDINAKDFTFAIYPDGSRTIPARAASAGMQDGIDFLNALARHPATAQRLANRLWRFFVSETGTPDGNTINQIAQAYLSNNFSIKAMLQRIFLSDAFLNGSEFQRYSWPVEYVVRAIKEVGWNGLSVDTAMTPLSNMGQQLYEPPDVNGWELGPGWFSTSSMLSRMNFSSTLAANQKFNLARDAQPFRQSPEKVLSYLLTRYPTMGFSPTALTAMLDYLKTGAAWSGSDTQLQTKIPGLTRLIVGAGEYQFN